MRIIFVITEYEDNAHTEITKDIPVIPSRYDFITLDSNILYEVTAVIHHMDGDNYEATCGLKKVERKL